MGSHLHRGTRLELMTYFSQTRVVPFATIRARTTNDQFRTVGHRRRLQLVVIDVAGFLKTVTRRSREMYRPDTTGGSRRVIITSAAYHVDMIRKRFEVDGGRGNLLLGRLVPVRQTGG
jgi:hypothetical protein